ncbi:MAG: phosphoribosylanthranilate isomerase [Bryobacteraceae bacterium]
MIIKVCGITSREDALAAVEAGATALGFNFWPKSPRWIEPSAAAAIAAELPPGVLKAGVFVNETAEHVENVSNKAGLDVAQLHGACGTPRGIRVWKGHSVKEGFSSSVLEDPEAEAFLLDAPAGDQYGGTGRTFDWNLIRGLRCRIVLAGGLDASNVARAIEVARPWGVDACSRIESSPGRKDHAKMAAFVRAALDAALILQ